MDNAVAKAFFSSFKREETYRREYTSEKHFCRCVAEYIKFYNEVRPHLTLRYQKPQAFEEAYYLSYIKRSCSTSREL
ncbi:MAG: integrase core domain-containing protein [Oscillibacter sp.]|nr:integrase core domain-containing protein [Oscillibacter sp.]